MAKRTGAEILVDGLIGHGVMTLSCVPGESFLAALEALRKAQDRIRTIVCRQEGGAGFLAEAWGKLTGRPGVCFVTRGPGVANALIALHVARQDCTPMVLLVGQVGRDFAGREAFQEVDHRKLLSEVTKWADEVQDPARIPEFLARAFAVAMAGRRGPVALILPEDVLAAVAEVADVPPFEVAEPAPRPHDIARLTALLGAAERPLLILGGSGWSETAVADAAAFAHAFGLPVATAFRCQDRLDNTDPNYVGELGTSVTPRLAQQVKEADLIVAVGDRLGEITTSGYRLVEAPLPRQTLVHVHAGAEELGRVHRPELAIHAAVGPFFAAVRSLRPEVPVGWEGWTRAGRIAFEADAIPRRFGHALEMGEVMAVLGERLADDAILTNGAGNYTGWVHGHYRFRRFPTHLGPMAGAMGYGLPAALAARLAFPEREVVCFAGDGCFLMTGQELATAVRHRLKVIVLVLDNGGFGTIRMHQERRYPGVPFATDLANPDFAAFARSFGAFGVRVERTADFAPAFEEARAFPGPALLHLVLDPEAISTRSTIAEIRSESI